MRGYRGEYESAKQLLNEAIGLAPQAFRPRLVLSYVLLQEQKDLLAAERALRDVLALSPNHEATLRNLAVLLRSLGGFVSPSGG